MASASVFEGQLTRTWWYPVGSEAAGEHVNMKPGERYGITLFHNTIDGKRSANLNSIMVPGSDGISSLLMESGGHKISFFVDRKLAYIEIKRKGMTTFTYKCVIDGELIPDITSNVSYYDKQVFSVSLNGAEVATDHTNAKTTWYIVNTTRLEDGASTTNHRRFSDFARLHSQVMQNLKGHHLLLSLPSLPEKFSKLFTDHNDPAFIERRYVYMCVHDC